MSSKEVAVLGGGCFWCLETVYLDVRGVEKVVSGYAGGMEKNPSYESVCSGISGHAEVVEVTFDPSLITFREILEIFFTIHDPTTLNRQGNDAGTQYRSVIFYKDDSQKLESEKFISELTAEKVFSDQIVTEVKKLPEFYPAEEYHQDYYARNSNQPYCQFVVAPKLTKFREKFRAKAVKQSA